MPLRLHNTVQINPNQLQGREMHLIIRRAGQQVAVVRDGNRTHPLSVTLAD